MFGFRDSYGMKVVTVMKSNPCKKVVLISTDVSQQSTHEGHYMVALSI